MNPPEPKVLLRFVQGLGVLLIARVLVTALPAWAGSATADSIWSEQNALQRASQSVPSGMVITGSRCEQFQVRNDFRYRCTVTWGDPPATTTSPSAPLPAPAQP